MTDEVIAAVVDGLARRGVIADDLVTRDDVFSFIKSARDGDVLIATLRKADREPDLLSLCRYLRSGDWPDNAARVLKGR
jgi:hypothetical protein